MENFKQKLGWCFPLEQTRKWCFRLWQMRSFLFQCGYMVAFGSVQQTLANLRETGPTQPILLPYPVTPSPFSSSRAGAAMQPRLGTPDCRHGDAVSPTHPQIYTSMSVPYLVCICFRISFRGFCTCFCFSPKKVARLGYVCFCSVYIPK
jgi:hypothetical protein